jgi:hypothetical protein
MQRSDEVARDSVHGFREYTIGQSVTCFGSVPCVRSGFPISNCMLAALERL